jgi:predicted ATP-dependent endonuclease of OLD family
MHYKAFHIDRYKGITKRITIPIDSHPLMPIIGVNECGKTTILNGIFAFDFNNDRLNQDGRHLQDIDNLYGLFSEPPAIVAEIVVSHSEIRDALEAAQKTNPNLGIDSVLRRKKLSQSFPDSVQITRNLNTKNYSVDVAWLNAPQQDQFSRSIIRRLPYIMYFDDFRDSIEEEIEILRDKNGVASGWLAIVETLFHVTDARYSVFSLPTSEDRQRKSMLSAVQRKLNERLTAEWRTFRLDNSPDLEIRIDYKPKTNEISIPDPANPNIKKTTTEVRHYLSFDIAEKDKAGNDHFFYVSDRSKGFYWFFNFVMKLEFNPKARYESRYNCIYLLDEPGSYLHASAQSNLCKKLSELSKNNKVIYCTHSHYLLDPDYIPLNSIRIAEKDSNGNIRLLTAHEYSGNIHDRRSAFQPILDALHIRPFIVDITVERLIIVEGIYDYYCFDMFTDHQNVAFFPSTGCDNIIHYIPMCIAMRINYSALWDFDDAGRNARKKAEACFGSKEAERFFFLEFKGAAKPKVVLEYLVAADDLRMIRQELEIPANAAFERTILSLYYSGQKKKILKKVSQKTRDNFSHVFKLATTPSK